MGDWNRQEVYIDSNGLAEFFVNGKRQCDSQPCPFTGFILSPPFTRIHRIGLDPNTSAGIARDFIMDFDEIYVDVTRARVEIGDAATFGAFTHREAQIPTAWSDGSVTFTVNQGSFADGSTAYLFVVDDTGAASAGRQIMFAGASDSTAPAPPKTLRVN